MTPYRRLLELARREQELVRARAWDELSSVEAERIALVATLPETPPQAVRPLLEEAAACVQASIAELVGAVEDARAELGGLARGRRALSGYAGPDAATLDAVG